MKKSRSRTPRIWERKIFSLELNASADAIESAEEWARLYNEALWLERWRNRNRAEMIARLFGSGKR